MGARKESYIFLEIRDAVTAINQRVNLLGVVVDTTIPRQTNGTDCLCTLKIVDESHPTPGIPVRVFAENMEMLPHVETAGDIVQLSHVVMKTHGPDVFAYFNKKFSSFALYEGRHSTNFVPYQVSHKFCARDQDKELIAGLRKWSIVSLPDNGSEDYLFLKEMKGGQMHNVVCKVIHMCEVTTDEWMLFVWDGTDTPPLSLHTRLENELENPISLRLEPHQLPRDVLSKFPSVGTVLRVNADRGNVKLGLHFLKTGRWVRFSFMKTEAHSGLWRGMLMSSSKIRYLPDDEHIVLERERAYSKRVELKCGRMPFVCFPCPPHLTETDHDEVAFVTLMDVLAYPEVTAKFRCAVRVVAALPWQVEHFCSPRGTYRIRLTLEDPTARLHAFLYAEDGVNFFGGYPTIEMMAKKRNILLGVDKDDADLGKGMPRNPPWIQCCLKSYYTDKSDPWGTRCYRVFGTKLAD